MGSARADRRAREHSLHGDVLARRARPPLRAAGAGDDPEVDLGLAEPRGVAGDDEVAHQRQLAAPTQRVAVHGRDQRLGERRDARPAPDLVALELLRRGAVGHVGDVRARREHPRTAGDHDRPHTLVRVLLLESLVDLAHEIGAQGVQDLRPVERDGGDRRLDFDRDELVPHRGYHRPNGDRG